MKWIEWGNKDTRFGYVGYLCLRGFLFPLDLWQFLELGVYKLSPKMGIGIGNGGYVALEDGLDVVVDSMLELWGQCGYKR